MKGRFSTHSVRPNSQKLIALAIADLSVPAPMAKAVPACDGVAMKVTSLGIWGTRAEAPAMARSMLGEMGKVLPRAVLEALIVRPTGLKTQLREDLLDHRLLEGRRDDRQLATAVWAVFHVDLEHALEQLGPAQLHRVVVRAVRNTWCPCRFDQQLQSDVIRVADVRSGSKGPFRRQREQSLAGHGRGVAEPPADPAANEGQVPG